MPKDLEHLLIGIKNNKLVFHESSDELSHDNATILTNFSSSEETDDIETLYDFENLSPIFKLLNKTNFKLVDQIIIEFEKVNPLRIIFTYKSNIIVTFLIAPLYTDEDEEEEG